MWTIHTRIRRNCLLLLWVTLCGCEDVSIRVNGIRSDPKDELQVWPCEPAPADAGIYCHGERIPWPHVLEAASGSEAPPRSSVLNIGNPRRARLIRLLLLWYNVTNSPSECQQAVNIDLTDRPTRASDFPVQMIVSCLDASTSAFRVGCAPDACFVTGCSSPNCGASCP